MSGKDFGKNAKSLAAEYGTDIKNARNKIRNAIFKRTHHKKAGKTGGRVPGLHYDDDAALQTAISEGVTTALMGMAVGERESAQEKEEREQVAKQESQEQEQKAAFEEQQANQQLAHEEYMAYKQKRAEEHREHVLKSELIGIGKSTGNSIFAGRKNNSKEDSMDLTPLSLKTDACWKGYVQAGTKRKGNRTVPNCVPAGKRKAKVKAAGLDAEDKLTSTKRKVWAEGF